jgi:hypothetical protein
MKRASKVIWSLVILWALVLLLCWQAPAWAQTWVTANQGTVAWDVVAPIVATDTIKYQVYTRIGTTGNGAPVGGEIVATQLAITFSVEGRYFVGIKAIRYPIGETVGIPSIVSWSNDPLVCAAAGPFGFLYYVAPNNPIGLRVP